MQLTHKHTIHSHHKHVGWSNQLEPIRFVNPGEEILFQVEDASDGQITPDSDHQDILTVDSARVNPAHGPVYIDGAQPGDTLAIRFLEFYPSGWGWTANIPGFGLLADQFPDPYLHLWQYDPQSLTPALYNNFAQVPLCPFAGIVAVAPAATGWHSPIPPIRTGGNLDIKDIHQGSTLYLPVEVEGALLSIGDTHAAQGDGEVCGTAIESPMEVLLEVDLLKNHPCPSPMVYKPPIIDPRAKNGFDITTGIGPDLWVASQQAVSHMIDLLCRRHPHLNPVDAYLLCSVCGDLKISEIVDAPNWVVSFHFPRLVFE